MLKFMLDTEISIYPIKRRPELVRTAFNQHVGQMCVSAITQMELIFGAEKSSHPARNVLDVRRTGSGSLSRKPGKIPTAMPGEL